MWCKQNFKEQHQRHSDTPRSHLHCHLGTSAALCTAHLTGFTVLSLFRPYQVPPSIPKSGSVFVVFLKCWQCHAMPLSVTVSHQAGDLSPDDWFSLTPSVDAGFSAATHTPTLGSLCKAQLSPVPFTHLFYRHGHSTYTCVCTDKTAYVYWSEIAAAFDFEIAALLPPACLQVCAAMWALVRQKASFL